MVTLVLYFSFTIIITYGLALSPSPKLGKE